MLIVIIEKKVITSKSVVQLLQSKAPRNELIKCLTANFIIWTVSRVYPFSSLSIATTHASKALCTIARNVACLVILWPQHTVYVAITLTTCVTKTSKKTIILAKKLIICQLDPRKTYAKRDCCYY